ncbi:MAG: hypothetical protein AABZ78_03185 [Chloroflexota bacterium]
MRQNTERTAWTIMTIAFIAFCVLVVAVPLGTWQFISTSSVTQEVAVTLISGTVFVTRPGLPLQGVADAINDVEESTRVDSDANSQASITFSSSDKKTTLGSIQVYGSTRVKLVEMRSPQFEMWNPSPHRMIVDVPRGRTRINLAGGVTRSITLIVRAGNSTIQMDRPGSYSIEVTDQSVDVAVREGSALATSGGHSVSLNSGQRTVMRAGTPPQNAASGERNLLINGDFPAPLSTDWTIYKDRFDPNDSDGKIERTTKDGRNVVSFYRAGFNWGRLGVQQKVNRDVRDYRALRLHFALRVVKQNVLSCGQYGSECPMMAKIEYTDPAGNRREWVQGFFYLPDTSNTYPMRCVTCVSSATSHIRVQQDVWYFYDSPDLITLFKGMGFTPAAINTISIYAEGHSFESLISEVELLAGD